MQNGSSTEPAAAWWTAFGWIGSICAGLTAAILALFLQGSVAALEVYVFAFLGESLAAAAAHTVVLAAIAFAGVWAAGVTAPVGLGLRPAVVAWCIVVGYLGWAMREPRHLELLFGTVAGLALGRSVLRPRSRSVRPGTAR